MEKLAGARPSTGKEVAPSDLVGRFTSSSHFGPAYLTTRFLDGRSGRLSVLESIEAQAITDLGTADFAIDRPLSYPPKAIGHNENCCRFAIRLDYYLHMIDTSPPVSE
jgi:hypothetical protein